MIYNHPLSLQVKLKKTEASYDATTDVWASLQEFVTMIGDFNLSFYDFKSGSLVNAHDTDL